jgi:hypothetical protein
MRFRASCVLDPASEKRLDPRQDRTDPRPAGGGGRVRYRATGSSPVIGSMTFNSGSALTSDAFVDRTPDAVGRHGVPCRGGLGSSPVMRVRGANISPTSGRFQLNRRITLNSAPRYEFNRARTPKTTFRFLDANNPIPGGRIAGRPMSPRWHHPHKWNGAWAFATNDHPICSTAPARLCPRGHRSG